MSFVGQLYALLIKDFKVELRQKFAISSIMLYVACTVFSCYLSFSLSKGQVGIVTWNALFWVIMVFVGVNAASKSFTQEKEGSSYYYYSLCSPSAFIIAKILYNSILLVLIGVLTLSLYSLVMGAAIPNMGLFFVNMILGQLGFAAILTMMAAVAFKAGNNSTLMAILSFPLLYPLLLLLIKISKNAMDDLAFSVSSTKLLTLGLLDLMCIALAYLLYPYLWRN